MRRFIPEQISLSRILPLSLRQQRTRRALLEHLHDHRRIPHLWFGDQQIDMLRHDYGPDHHETVELASLLQDGLLPDSERAVADSRNR